MNKKNLVPDDKTVAERQRHASRFWPTKSVRATAVPPPLRHLREFEDLAAERSAVIAAETAYIARRDALNERNEETLQTHRLAVHAAVDAGEQPPTAPTLEQSHDLPVETTILASDDGQPGRPWHVDPTLDRCETQHCCIEATELCLMAEKADHWKAQMPVSEARERVEDAERELMAARNALAPLDAAIRAIDEVAEPLKLARDKRADDRAQATEREEWQGVWQPLDGRVESAEAADLMAEAQPAKRPTGRR